MINLIININSCDGSGSGSGDGSGDGGSLGDCIDIEIIKI